MASGTSNPAVTITNQSGVDVEIFDVYNPNPSGKKGTYTYTSLGTVQNGARATLQTLHFASQLQAFYTGQVAAVNNTYYENFPVAVLAVSILDDSTLNQTITADDRTGMEQAFLFARYSAANADSRLTQQFVAALASQDQASSVDAFFAGTANFSKASVVAWDAITNWESQFLSAWQGPYYLYQNDTSARTIKLIAVVNIVSSATESSARLYIADQDGSYTSASQNVDIVQAGDGTINEKDVGTAPISLTLTPVWMSISTVSPQGDVSYAIGGAMSGTVNGVQVMGTGQKINVPSGSGSGSGSSSSSWYDQFSKLFSLTLSTVGMLTSMGMLFIMFKQWRGEKTQKANDIVNKSPDPRADEDAIRQEQADAETQIDAQARPQAEQQVASAQADVQQLSSNSKEITTANQQIEARTTIEAQTEKITDLLTEAPPSDKTEDAVSDVMDSRNALDEGDVDGAFESLGKAADTTAEMASDVDSRMSDAQKAEAEAIKEDMENSQDLQDTLQEKQEEQDALKEQDPEDQIPDDKLTDDAPAEPAFEGGE